MTMNKFSVKVDKFCLLSYQNPVFYDSMKYLLSLRMMDLKEGHFD